MIDNTKTNYRQFDVVWIRKLHANNVFDSIENNNYLIDFSAEEYIKKRPAIILKALNKNSFVVISLTTQLINKGSENNYLNQILRSEFNCVVLPKKSYLMFEGILRVNKNQIIGFFKVKKQKVKLNGANKKWLQEEATEKYTKMFG